MNTEAYEAMKLACENFVNKVKTGRVRSKNSYEEMKKALLLAKENDALDLAIKWKPISEISENVWTIISQTNPMVKFEDGSIKRYDDRWSFDIVTHIQTV